MKRLVVSLIAIASLVPVSMVMTGCQTIPEGWGETSPVNIVDFTSMLIEALKENDPETLEMRKCIIESGLQGCVDFWKSRDSDQTMNARLLSAANVADKYAEDRYASLYEEYGSLAGISLKFVLIHINRPESSWITVTLNEGEILLALINAFVDSGSYGSAFNQFILGIK